MALLDWLGLTGGDGGGGSGTVDQGPGFLQEMFTPAGAQPMMSGLPQDQQEALRQNMMTQSLLGLGAGLLQAAGPHTDPRKASLGYGLSQGVHGMMQGQQGVMQNFAQGQQIQQRQAELERQQQLRDTYANLLGGGDGTGRMSGGGQAAVPTSPGGSQPAFGQGPITNQQLALAGGGGPSKGAAEMLSGVDPAALARRTAGGVRFGGAQAGSGGGMGLSTTGRAGGTGGQRTAPQEPWSPSGQLLDAVKKQESGGAGPRPVSPAGALGPYQIMPVTARDFGVENTERLFDEPYARKKASEILQKYTGMFDGNVRKGVAAYNAGPKTVRTLVEKYGDAWEKHLPNETKGYLKNVGPAIRKDQMRGARAASAQGQRASGQRTAAQPTTGVQVAQGGRGTTGQGPFGLQLTDQERALYAALPPEQGIQLLLQRRQAQQERRYDLADKTRTRKVRGEEGGIYEIEERLNPRTLQWERMGDRVPVSRGSWETIRDPESPTGYSLYNPVTQQKRPGATKPQPLIDRGQDPGDAYRSEALKGLAKSDITLYEEEIVPNAARASETLALVDQLQAVPEEAFQTGAFGEARGFLSRLTELMGADPQAVPGLGSGGAIDLIQSSGNQLTVQLMSRIKGNLNETEVNIVRRAVPGLLMTPEGNKILSRIMRRSAERSRKRLSMAEDYIQKHGGLRAPDKDVPSFQAKWLDYTRDNPVINEDLRRTIGGLTGKAVKRFVSEVPDNATNVERLQNSQVFEGEDGRRTTVPAGSIRYKINGEWKWIPPGE